MSTTAFLSSVSPPSKLLNLRLVLGTTDPVIRNFPSNLYLNKHKFKQMKFHVYLAKNRNDDYIQCCCTYSVVVCGQIHSLITLGGNVTIFFFFTHFIYLFFIFQDSNFFRSVLSSQKIWLEGTEFIYVPCTYILHSFPHYQHHPPEWYIYLVQLTNLHWHIPITHSLYFIL